MPLLFYGPGGGGAGGNGYKYQSKGVVGLSYGINADGSLTLNWSDPEDGAPASEWKGTVVVCKEGEPPKSVDDGEIVCESAVKNQYRDAGLVLDVGGPGYYYGVFPYTKDGVVNTDGANVVYIPNAGYDVPLENASWSDIAYIADRGDAEQIWSLGDEKELILSGVYNVAIHMQIVGFGHDSLVGGGTAGISFASKEIVAYAHPGSVSSWAESQIKTVVFPGIESSLPAALRKIIKNVRKERRSKFMFNYPSIVELEEKLFGFSSDELGLGNVVGNGKRDEGKAYPFFSQDASSRVKKEAGGNSPVDWWTCSGLGTTTSSFKPSEWYAVDSKGDRTNIQNYMDKGIVFGFCV